MTLIFSIVALAGAYTYQTTQDNVRTSTNEELTREAELQSVALEKEVQGIRSQAVLLSGAPTLNSIQDGSYDSGSDSISEFLRSQLDSDRISERVAAIHLVEPRDGALTITKSTNDQFVGERPEDNDVPWATKVDELSAGQAMVSDTFTAPSGRDVIAVISPVPDTDRYVVMMVDLKRWAKTLTKPSADGGWMHIVDSNGEVVLSTRSDQVGTQNMGPSDDQSVDSMAVKRGLAGRTGVVQMTMNGQQLVMGHAPVASTDWVVMTHVPRSNAYALSQVVGLDLLLLLGVVGVTTAVGAVGFARHTVRPLRRLQSLVARIEDGELDVRVSSDRTDEIGDLYGGVDEMRRELQDEIEATQRAQRDAERARSEAEEMSTHLRSKADEYQDALAAIASGDLTVQVDPDANHESMRQLGVAINDVSDQLAETVGDLRTFADQVADSMDSLSENADQVARAGENVSATVRSISDDADTQRAELQSAVDEMNALSATVEEIASTTDEIAEGAETAVELSDRGEDAARGATVALDEVETVTSEAVEQVEQLVAHVEQIEAFADVIGDVAEQTDMLALNANIEAARADTDGGNDGFAVVADEIKSLAAEAGDRADDIEQLVTEVSDQTENTAERMQTANARLRESNETTQTAIEMLERIGESVRETNQRIQNINRATDDQAATTEQVTAMIEEVEEISSQNAADAKEAVDATDRQVETITEVAETVDGIAQKAETLRVTAEQFELTDRTVDGGQSPVVADGGRHDDGD
ncbi:methyl-accepting chemotaxis protein [Halobaculum sp. MBLA0147]|uniref:methyl-accepting chemotaxis protein n=1 Tax=Halobaculum sp. MBLA0147 TaxID=3079934 RepID=UPI003526B40A